MRNAGLDEARVKTAGRNTNNLRYADNTILMAEREELKTGNGTPLQCSCLENPMDGGASGLQSMESQKSQTRL